MKIKKSKWHLLIIGIIAVQLFPIIYMISISLKSSPEIFSNPFGIIPKKTTFENYNYILKNIPVFKYLWNTFFIAFFSSKFFKS